MNLNDDKKEPLRLLPIEKKRRMLVSYHKGATQESRNKFDKPQQIIEYLQQHSKSEFTSFAKLLSCLESLRVALTNNTLSWVSEFGVEGLMTILQILATSIKSKM